MDIIEREIGEVFELNGINYKVCKMEDANNICKKCSLDSTPNFKQEGLYICMSENCVKVRGACRGDVRSDKQQVVFIKTDEPITKKEANGIKSIVTVKKDLKNLKVGDSVYDLQWGDGKVLEIGNNAIKVDFKNYIPKFYEFDGTEPHAGCETINPTLYKEKPEIIMQKWKPATGERYFSIQTNGYGKIEICENVNSGVDFGDGVYVENALDQNNCFKTLYKAQGKFDEILKVLAK